MKLQNTMGFLILVIIALYGCSTPAASPLNDSNTSEVPSAPSDTHTAHLRPFVDSLPTIGLLMYNGVLTTEVTATADVFTKPAEAGEQLFNVITIAESAAPIVTEEGLKILPDHTFANCPHLDVLFVPSAYDMNAQVHNPKIVEFVRSKNDETQYTVSNCAGAQLIGASGIAAGRKIVTWIGGGKQLQLDFPDLLVQNDSIVTYVEDGKFSSSNGNLASYISALELVEKMTDPAHRKFVESCIYIDRLRNYKR